MCQLLVLVLFVGLVLTGTLGMHPSVMVRLPYSSPSHMTLMLNKFNSGADIDECQVDTTLCDQICMNTDGSFTCTCHEGYQLTAGDKQCQGW